MAKRLTHKTRAIRKLEELGWTVADVEKWIPRTNIKQDLFGIFDLVAIKGKKTLGLQVTDATHTSHHVETMLGLSESVALCLKAGWLVELWGINKSNGREYARTRYFELSDGGQAVTAYEGSSILKG